MTLRVVVVEDDSRYRSTLEQLLSQADGFSVAGTFSSPLSALAELELELSKSESVPWDIVIMDIEMPRMNGIAATKRIKALIPGVKVVVLTVFEDPATILEAICAGADGYLLKKSRANELLQGIRSVTEGGAPLTANVARKVLEMMRTVNAPDAARTTAGPSRFDLTEREQQVLRGLVEGLSYKQVAEVLGLSLGTVRTHISSIYRKLQVHSIGEAVNRALRNRMV